jgi:prepilin-type N-terminal cleavage/methylation domain-containing protein
MRRVKASIKRLDAHGFTLIEVLMATAILAVMISLIYTSFNQTANLSAHMDKVSGHYREARLVLSKMSDELQSTYYYKDDQETDFGGTDGVGGEGLDADSITFTSMSRGPTGGAPGSFHHGLKYHMDGTQLMYTETFNMLGTGPGNVLSFPLIEDLAGFRLRYLPKDSDEWRDGWDQAVLPTAVEVTLLFAQNRGESKDLFTGDSVPVLPLSTVIRVPMGGA